MEGEADGYIAFKQPWPGIMRTVYGDQERFEKTYFQRSVSKIRIHPKGSHWLIYCNLL